MHKKSTLVDTVQVGNIKATMFEGDLQNRIIQADLWFIIMWVMWDLGIVNGNPHANWSYLTRSWKYMCII